MEIESSEINLDEFGSNENANLKAFNFINQLDIDTNAAQKLSASLSGVLRGNDVVLRSPIAKNLNTDDILLGWDTIFNANLKDVNKTLLDVENNQRDKFGPRSIQAPWKQRRSSLYDYFTTVNSTSSYSSSFVDMLDYKSKLRPLSLSNSISELKNSTSSGLPFLLKKGNLKERYMKDFNKLLARRDPCVLFTRTQEQGKTRNVWGYPMADTINEMRYFKPILKYTRSLPWRAALIGPDAVDRAISQQINAALANNQILISIDFSSYDASIGDSLFSLSCDMTKSLFQSQFHHEIESLYDRIKSIPIITPDGIIRGNHGVPSGSTFTNHIDSDAQLAAGLNSGINFVGMSWQIQGDDGVWRVHERDIDILLNTFKSFGLNLNEDKSSISGDHCTYLQMLYHKDYQDNGGLIRGIYPTYRALNRIIHQERWSSFEDYNIEGRDYYSIRTISILENCRNHPLFVELVKYILSIDKYGLHFSNDGLRKYVRMLEESSGVTGLIINQYGDDVKGIKRFETYKLIKKLSKA